MKKMEKMVYIIKMIAAAIEDAKVKFSSEIEEPVFFNYYNTDEDDIVIPLMISSYDHDHKHLVSNWLCNSYDGTSEFMKSKKLEYICDKLELDMPHFTWNQENLIHKMRYVQILERNEIEHLDAPRKYILCKERGYEYDLFKRKVYPIEKAWVSWKEGGEN